jgi:hypothetical protein
VEQFLVATAFDNEDLKNPLTTSKTCGYCISVDNLDLSGREVGIAGVGT